SPIQGALTQKVLLLFLFILVSVFLAVIITNAFIRRDLTKISQLIDSATQISSGSTDVSIPERVGNAEIDQLTDALSKMVTALQTSVEVERAAQVRMQEFLGDASHELRTPLTVLKGYIELLSANESISSEDRKKIFERLSSESKRMESLINDLLLLAELGETTDYPYEQINFSEVLRNSIRDLTVLQPNRSITENIESNIKISASSELIHQLIANITSNIRRHTPEVQR
ncbi:MAG: sensor histidine kinase, partial [Actinobacteria bacterium]|nr:sensor histidine kinase [Actinomycetota bacterium]